MRQRLLGTLLWCVLVPVAGFGALLWAGLRAAVARIERVLVLGGLAVCFSMPNPVAAQFSQGGIPHEVLAMLPWVLAGLGLVLLGFGLQASWLRRVRRTLQHCGWCF